MPTVENVEIKLQIFQLENSIANQGLYLILKAISGLEEELIYLQLF